MRFPALFIGHGSPMNAITNTVATQAWANAAASMPKPDAILVVSAHWTEPRVGVTAMEKPRTIHDFGGFPKELFEQQYPSPGSPEIARRVKDLLSDTVDVELVEEGWGLDHGSWSVLTKMYPEADIPVVELTLDSRKRDLWHYEIGKKLSPLRNENVLILASGSLVHNLREWDFNNRTPTPYAKRFNDFVVESIKMRKPASEHPLVNWRAHPDGNTAHPTPEHYQPLLYLLGLIEAAPEDEISTFLENEWDLPAVSMLSVKLEETVKSEL